MSSFENGWQFSARKDCNDAYVLTELRKKAAITEYVSIIPSAPAMESLVNGSVIIGI